MSRLALTRLAASFLALCSCAVATMGSGVGDRLMERPPWSAGTAARVTRVAHLPVLYQRGASQEPLFDPEGGAGTPVAALLADLNQALDGLARGAPARRAGPMPGTPPDVMFGCEVDQVEECVLENVGKPRYRLAAARPSRAWSRWAAETLDRSEADALLLVTLEVGQYLTRQKDLLGRKVVDLGADHVASLPWLTSLETPVSVIQLTGALVDRSGRVLRIAAEGMLARRTTLPASSIGLQTLVTDAEVERLRRARREDLPGRPPVLRAAMESLLAELARGR